MDARTQQAFEDLIEEQRRRPLSDLRVASGQARQGLSFASRQAAENLLTKALRALREDDAPKADRFIQRALQLDFDEHEEVWPGLYTAHLMLFSDITDARESSAEGDTAWLDAVLEILPLCEPEAQTELLTVLAVVRHDDKMAGHNLGHAEKTLIDRTLRPHPEIDPLADPVDPDDPAGYIRELLGAIRLYGRR